MATCNRCNGTGKVRGKKDKTWLTHETFYYDTACPKCGGTGRVDDTVSWRTKTRDGQPKDRPQQNVKNSSVGHTWYDPCSYKSGNAGPNATRKKK